MTWNAGVTLVRMGRALSEPQRRPIKTLKTSISEQITAAGNTNKWLKLGGSDNAAAMVAATWTWRARMVAKQSAQLPQDAACEERDALRKPIPPMCRGGLPLSHVGR